MSFSYAQDLFPLTAAVLAALVCGILGNFLVLRRLSLMGDAISHSVLPGLVVAFLIAGSRSTGAMLVGATLAGIATVALVELVKRLGRVEPGAAMGVVFSILFATGVLLIERASVRQVDLDADCVLHGQLETLAWYDAPATLAGVLDMQTLAAVPVQITTLAATLMLVVICTVVLFKELRLAAFDGALSTSLGFHAGALHVVLMVLVAIATVASFEAVGSILVIAMLICPAATARLLTDRLGTQIAVSVGVAIASAVGGYVGATLVPGVFGLDSVNAAGSMTVVAGGLLLAAAVLSPSRGVLAAGLRRRQVAKRVLVDDMLAALYRQRERGEQGVPIARLQSILAPRPVNPAIASTAREGLVERAGDDIALTATGEQAAAAVIRSHRLWETYLVEEAGLASDHVHTTAAQLEHVGINPPIDAARDPHGKPVPRAAAEDSTRPGR